MKNLLVSPEIQQLRQSRDFASDFDKKHNQDNDAAIRFADVLDNALSSTAQSQNQPDYQGFTQARYQEYSYESEDAFFDIDAYEDTVNDDSARSSIAADTREDDEVSANSRGSAQDDDAPSDRDEPAQDVEAEYDGRERETVDNDSAPLPNPHTVSAQNTEILSPNAESTILDDGTAQNDNTQSNIQQIDGAPVKDLLNEAVTANAQSTSPSGGDDISELKTAAAENLQPKLAADSQNPSQIQTDDIAVSIANSAADSILLSANGQEQLPPLPQTALQLAQSVAQNSPEPTAQLTPNAAQNSPEPTVRQLTPNAAQNSPEPAASARVRGSRTIPPVTPAQQTNAEALPVEKLTVTADKQPQFQLAKNLQQPLRVVGDTLISSQEISGSGSQLLEQLKVNALNPASLNKAATASNTQTQTTQAASLVTQQPPKPVLQSEQPQLQAPSAEPRTSLPNPQLGGEGKGDAQHSQPQAHNPGNAVAADNANIQGSGAKFAAQLASGSQHHETRNVHNQLIANIQRGVKEGQARIHIQLNPAELGRVDVQIETAADGKLQLIIAPEKVETLDLLQRDSSTLQQALQNAGIDVNAESLTFLLREQFAQGRKQQGQDNNKNSQPQDEAKAAADEENQLDDDIIVGDDGRINVRV